MSRPFWLLLFLAGCGPQPYAPAVTDPAQERRPDVARHFTVFDVKDARRLLVFGDTAHLDTLADITIASGGVMRLATLSTTHLPYISALKGVDRLVAAAHLDQVRDSITRAHRRTGELTEIATADGIDREALIAAAPDLLLGYPFGRTGTDATTAGVPVLMIAEYLEPHPLGRAEWLRFFGALLGKQPEADSLFAGIAARYSNVKEAVPDVERPRVFFGSHWNGQWWVPPGNSYMAQLIQDAGGDYVFADKQGKENVAVDLETILTRTEDARFWGMIAQLPDGGSMTDFTGGDGRLAHLAALKDGLFLGNTARADLFGQALVEPDRVLADLVGIFSGAGTKASGDLERHYFEAVPAERPDHK